MAPKLDPIDPRYDYAPDVAPSEGLGITLFDRKRGILRLTTVAAIQEVGTGDYLLTVRAKSVNDLDAETPAEEPEEEAPGEEEPGEEEGEEGETEEPGEGEETPPAEEEGEETGGETPAPTPTPTPTPIPAPPSIPGATTVSTPAQLDAALRAGGNIKMIGTGWGDYVIAGRKGAKIVIDASQATVRTMRAGNSQNIDVYGLTFVNDKTGWTDGSAMWRTERDCDAVNLFDARGTGWTDTGDAFGWSQAQWLARKLSAVLNLGTNCIVARCDFRKVYMGVQAMGDGCRTEDNVVRWFSADAYRAPQGNGISVLRNRAHDAFLVDGNHPDGAQFWSVGADGKVGTGTQKSVAFTDNLIVEWTGPATHALRAKLQGIGGFDGMYDGFSFLRNTTLTSHTAYHGLTMAGLLNSVVEGNQILDITGGLNGGVPYINIGSHKDGRPSAGCAIRNNVAAGINYNNVSLIGQNGNTRPDYSKIDLAAIKARATA